MQAQVNEEQTYTPLPLRSHTILGVCEAIGEDFGFNPTWLRVPFAATVLISPMMAIGAYFADHDGRERLRRSFGEFRDRIRHIGPHRPITHQPA